MRLMNDFDNNNLLHLCASHVYGVFQTQDQHHPLSKIYHSKNRQIIISRCKPIRINGSETSYTRFERFNSIQLINAIIRVEWIELFFIYGSLDSEQSRNSNAQKHNWYFNLTERRMTNAPNQFLLFWTVPNSMIFKPSTNKKRLSFSTKREHRKYFDKCQDST